MELAVIARHAESEYNVAGLVNGDPTVPVPLTAHGAGQARQLGLRLASLDVGACLHSRFPRARETARLALAAAGSRAPLLCDARLDDIGCGSMEGWPVARDHEWRGARARDACPRGGESVAMAARRIADGLRAVAARRERTVAVVTHELVVRYALNAAGGSADLAAPVREVPNASPFVLGRRELLRAADTVAALADGDWGRAQPGAAANGG